MIQSKIPRQNPCWAFCMPSDRSTDGPTGLSWSDQSVRPVHPPGGILWTSQTGRPDRSDQSRESSGPLSPRDRSARPVRPPVCAFYAFPLTSLQLFIYFYASLYFSHIFRHSTSREDSGDISFAQIGRRMSPQQFAQVAWAVFWKVGQILG